MTPEAILELVLPIIRDTLSNPKVHAESRMDDTRGWDSLKHIQILAAIEDDLKIEVSHNDIIEMVSVPRMVEVLAKYLPEEA